MATNKENQMSTINEESIKTSLKVFKSVYKENKEKYEETNVKVEDVVALSEGFIGKSSLLATTVIISVLIAMPPRECMALIETIKTISKAKFLEAIQELIGEKMKNGADSDIDN